MTARGRRLSDIEWAARLAAEWTEPGAGRMRNVPTMTINDPEIYKTARHLAMRHRTSMTEAVRRALHEALVRDVQEMRRETTAKVAQVPVPEPEPEPELEPGPVLEPGPETARRGWLDWLR